MPIIELALGTFCIDRLPDVERDASKIAAQGMPYHHGMMRKGPNVKQDAETAVLRTSTGLAVRQPKQHCSIHQWQRPVTSRTHLVDREPLHKLEIMALMYGQATRYGIIPGAECVKSVYIAVNKDRGAGVCAPWQPLLHQLCALPQKQASAYVLFLFLSQDFGSLH